MKIAHAIQAVSPGIAIVAAPPPLPRLPAAVPWRRALAQNSQLCVAGPAAASFFNTSSAGCATPASVSAKPVPDRRQPLAPALRRLQSEILPGAGVS